MRKSGLIAATCCAMLVSSGAMAASLSITSILAEWTNPVGGSSVVIKNAAPTSTVEWGDGSPTTSGYDFTVEATPFSDPASPFRIGTFTHRNEVIDPEDGIVTVDLVLSLTGTFEGTPFALGQTWHFDHDETPFSPNPADCPGQPQIGSVGCDDFVTIALVVGSSPSVSVTSGPRIFTLSVLGFSTDDGATITSLFQTPEGGTSTAGLYGRIDVAVIPLPAAVWLLLAGVGGLGVIARRKRMAA